MSPPADNPFPNAPFGSTDGLAARAQQGDDRSFDYLFRRVAPAIYTFACARIDWRWQDAEDAVAETWVRACQRFDSYDPNRSFRGWVFGFASRVVMEVQRRVARGAGGGLQPLLDREMVPAEATSVSQLVARDEKLREFADWVRNLSEYEREVLVLRGLQGLPHDEVAATLGHTVTGVKECWRRVLKKVEAQGRRGLLLADGEGGDPGSTQKGA